MRRYDILLFSAIGVIVGIFVGWWFRESQEMWCDKFYREYKPWLEYGSFTINPIWNADGKVVGWGASANEEMLNAMSKELSEGLHPRKTVSL